MFPPVQGCRGRLVTTVVDAHHHVWDAGVRDHSWLVDYPKLLGRYDLEDYAEATAGTTLAGSILVQVLDDEEESTEFLALAARSTVVAGVVGYVDLKAPDVAARITRQRAGEGGHRLVGLRQVGGQGPNWLDDPALVAGLEQIAESGLVFDLRLEADQVASAIRAVRQVPAGRFVVDHGAKPDIERSAWQPWAELMAELASHPNVACKVSGLVTEAGEHWNLDGLAPYVGHLVECFGPERLVFGSDWPVCTEVATFADVLTAARTILSVLLDDDQVAAVLAGNAISIYGLALKTEG
jgi:L-fuconolactonase